MNQTLTECSSPANKMSDYTSRHDHQPKGLLRAPKPRFIAVLIVSSLVLVAGYSYIYGQDKSGFPDGYDAVQAAPNSHKVIFENAFVRVLEVTMPTTARPVRDASPPLAEFFSELG